MGDPGASHSYLNVSGVPVSFPENKISKYPTWESTL